MDRWDWCVARYGDATGNHVHHSADSLLSAISYGCEVAAVSFAMRQCVLWLGEGVLAFEVEWADEMGGSTNG